MKKTDNLILLQENLGYTFNDKTLLKKALTHKSAHHQNNERLEFLGDAILNFIIADVLYQQFSTATEGELTRARALLVRKATLCDVASEFSLGEYLSLGIGEQRSGGFRRESILADAFEAIIGAIYLDGGFNQAQTCVQKYFSSRLSALNPEKQEKDPKTQLQEWLQANQKLLPIYKIVSVVGEPHAQTFTVRCEVEGISEVIEGIGSSRRIAEQQAASKILALLKSEKVK